MRSKVWQRPPELWSSVIIATNHGQPGGAQTVWQNQKALPGVCQEAPPTQNAGQKSAEMQQKVQQGEKLAVQSSTSGSHRPLTSCTERPARA